MTNKDLLAPKEMTSAEVRSLVDEYLAEGGKITHCAPGVALNFRGGLAPEVTEKPKVTVIRKKNKKGKNKKK